MMIDSSKTDSFSIKKINFDITHIKLKTTHNNKHSISYSAADRVVKEESLIGKLPGLFGTLKEDDEKFAYLCFVTSDYLTKNVTPERLGFNIPETSGLYSEIEISFSEIRNEVMEKVSKFLDPFLSENKEIGMQKVNEFVNTKAPRYKSIINHIPEEERIFDPNISDKELDLKLHSFLMKLETELLEEGHDILTPNLIENKDEYTKRVQDYLKKSTDVKRYDLANYVTHRKVILDLLTQAVCINEDGKYFKEEIIHKLIMPMQTTSNDVCFEECNLWLIDERLAFHNFLSSDKTLKSIDITNSDSTKEPDILSLNIYDNPLLVNDNQNLPLASITVVEIKRPMRNDAKAGEDKDPIEQALNYLNRVRKGKVKTQTGRLIPNSENIPGFCYVICDITDTVKDRCDIMDLKVTSDKMGYFGFHKTFNCYIEVISYDRLLNMAKERNRAFFDKLGLPAF